MTQATLVGLQAVRPEHPDATALRSALFMWRLKLSNRRRFYFAPGGMPQLTWDHAKNRHDAEVNALNLGVEL